MVSEPLGSRRFVAGSFVLLSVLICCLCPTTTVATAAGPEGTRHTKEDKTLGGGYDEEEMKELRRNLRELQEDVQTILKKVQQSEELHEGTYSARTWFEWFMGSEPEAPAPEAPMGPREACMNFFECFTACTVMAFRSAKMVWLSVTLPILGERAEWMAAVASTYLPMNNFIEVVRSLCLIIMCYQLAKAIIPAPIFEVLMQMILSPFTLTRAIIWSMVDFLGTACFKEAWGNLKEYWKIQNSDKDEGMARDQTKDGQKRTHTSRSPTKSVGGAPLKDFCPTRRTIRSKKDLNVVMENVKFQISDEFSRIHALLHSLDDTDAATARFAAFLRKECAKITNSETLPQSSHTAQACGLKIQNLWDGVVTKTHQYFAAAGGDVFASLQELQGLRKEAGEDLPQYIARYISTWANLEPSVPEPKAIEVLLPVLPRDFVRNMSGQSIHETTLDQVARAFRNYNEWLTNAQQQQVQAPLRQFRAQDQGRAPPFRRDMRQDQPRGRQFVQRETRRCFICGKQGHLAAQCPTRRTVHEVNAPEGFELALPPQTTVQGQEVQHNREPNEIQPETPEQVFHDEGSDVEESALRNESVNVFSIAKAGNPFVAKKIHITFQFTDKHKKSQPVKTLVDTGSCANVISFSTLQKLGYAKADLIHDSGVPTALTGFAGEDARTLGGIFLKVRLGRVTREVPFIVMNDVLTHCILGMPAIDAFDFHIRGRARAVSF